MKNTSLVFYKLHFLFNVMVDYNKAFTRPFTDFKKFFIGFIFSLPLPFVSIFTNISAIGYYYECGRSSFNNRYRLPEWKNFGTLWVRGLLGGVIGLCYLLPAILVFVFLLAKNISIVYTFESFNPLSLFANFGPWISLPIALIILASYLLPIAILNFVTKANFRAAFDFGFIFKRTFTVYYLSVWVIITLINVFFILIGTLYFLPMVHDAMAFRIMMLIYVFAALRDHIMGVFSFTLYGRVLKQLK